MRFFALVTDAYGGFGGIAQYNRDLLDALCSLPEISSVEALPRLIAAPPGPLPGKLTYRLEGLGGLGTYTATALRNGLFGPKPDVVICGHLNFLPLAVLIARVRRARLLMLIYGIDAWEKTNRMADRLAGSVDTVVSISRITLERYFRNFDPPLGSAEVLPNAIRQEEYGTGPKAPDLVERFGLTGRTVLMTFGRLATSERAKGFDEVIELLPRLRDRDPTILYMIAGTGDDGPRLEAKAAKLGLAKHVVLTGFVPEERKADYFRLADAYVMPSRGEGFGFVFLEAMACGVPVLASRSDGGFEAVRGGSLGVIVDPDDPDSIYSGIFEALARPRSVPKGLAYFSFENFKSRLRSILFPLPSACDPAKKLA